MKVETIEPRAAAERLGNAGAGAAGGAPILLDVREPDEVALCRIPGSLHIPMHDIPRRLRELDPERPIIVHCHHGVRSEKVARFLLQQDFAEVTSLRGGIDAWSLEVDPSVPRY